MPANDYVKLEQRLVLVDYVSNELNLSTFDT
jgi:hypothetical protein